MALRPFTSFALIPALGILLLGSGCERSFLTGRVDEGAIEYAITFPDIDPDGLMAGMLPDKSVLSFDREHQSMDLSAGMGLFRTSMVVNTPKKVVDYHICVMGKKLVAVMHPRDLLHFNKATPPVAVLFTGDRDTIAGYPCRKATLVFADMGTPEQDVWFTDQIDMDTPNWYGPFKDIPGVMLRYEFTQNNVRMQLNATSVKPEPVPASTFQLRPDHQQVPPDALYAQLDEVLGTLNQ